MERASYGIRARPSTYLYNPQTKSSTPRVKNNTMNRSKPSLTSEPATSLQFEDGGYTVLAHGQAQVRILDAVWRGNAEVRLELTPTTGVYVHALFKAKAACGPLTHAASDPRAVSNFSLDGKPIDGFATQARLVRNEPDELLVKWCPTHDPLSALGDNFTQIRRLNAHLFDSPFPNLDLTAGPWTLTLRRTNPRWTGRKAGDARAGTSDCPSMLLISFGRKFARGSRHAA